MTTARSVRSRSRSQDLYHPWVLRARPSVCPGHRAWKILRTVRLQLVTTRVSARRHGSQNRGGGSFTCTVTAFGPPNQAMESLYRRGSTCHRAGDRSRVAAEMRGCATPALYMSSPGVDERCSVARGIEPPFLPRTSRRKWKSRWSGGARVARVLPVGAEWLRRQREGRDLFRRRLPADHRRHGRTRSGANCSAEHPGVPHAVLAYWTR